MKTLTLEEMPNMFVFRSKTEDLCMEAYGLSVDELRSMRKIQEVITESQFKDVKLFLLPLKWADSHNNCWVQSFAWVNKSWEGALPSGFPPPNVLACLKNFGWNGQSALIVSNEGEMRKIVVIQVSGVEPVLLQMASALANIDILVIDLPDNSHFVIIDFHLKEKTNEFKRPL